MTDENTEVNADETPAPEEGGGKKKKKKLTFKEQMRELRPFFIFLLFAIPAYGVYHFGSEYVGTDFTLEDQFQKEHTIDFSGDKPIVMMFLEGDGTKDAMKWGLKLAITYGDKIENVRLMYLNNPQATKYAGITRGQIQKLTQIPMLLDFDGKVFNRYFCEEGMANIMVIAPNRMIKYRVTGEMDDEAWEALAAALDPLVAVEAEVASE